MIFQAFKISSKFVYRFKKYTNSFKQREGIFGKSAALKIGGPDLMHPGM